MGRVDRRGRDVRRAGLLGDAVEYLGRSQPELSAEGRDGYIAVRGKFVVRDDAGPLDSFEVCMAIPLDFPFGEPLVWEVGGRIPRIADRHVFEKDGNLCLGVWEAWLAKTPSVSFAAYMDGPVADYFFGQSLVDIEQPWPFGERDHGLPGVLDAYGEVLGLDADLEAIKSYLLSLASRSLKGHHRCPCGSGRRVRDCHWDQVRTLSGRIPPPLADRKSVV